MLVISKTEPSRVTPINCPDCGEKLARVGLLHDSAVRGLTFKCKRCGELWAVTTGTEDTTDTTE